MPVAMPPIPRIVTTSPAGTGQTSTRRGSKASRTWRRATPAVGCLAMFLCCSGLAILSTPSGRQGGKSQGRRTLKDYAADSGEEILASSAEHPKDVRTAIAAGRTVWLLKGGNVSPSFGGPTSDDLDDLYAVYHDDECAFAAVKVINSGIQAHEFNDGKPFIAVAQYPGGSNGIAATVRGRAGLNAFTLVIHSHIDAGVLGEDGPASDIVASYVITPYAGRSGAGKWELEETTDIHSTIVPFHETKRYSGTARLLSPKSGR
jgi:hypothetical protein